ncbi:acyl-CoA dehydrogenase/oxidase [Mycena galopus ATCC 62051]|nr:acyl-CoA dehydrogenase/oxidase [Mycena galopus ATCC 62051]
MSGNVLAQTHLFTRATYDFALPDDQRQEVTHARAKAIAMSFDLTVEDILTCSKKFWNCTLHPINTVDGAATALWTIHVNLACDTLTQYAGSRPELRELCRQILAFEISAHYMLTEVGHGLDSQNIETTAELLPNGNFEIYTPNTRAAKFMPASIPAGGVPRIAIVMAQLMVNGHRGGIRPFVVPLNDGETMHSGVSCRVLPHRSGTRPVGHAITSFNHVKVPATALIGDLDSGLRPRIQFLASIWRLGVGSATMAALCIPALRVAAHIATQYAKRRTVSNSHGDIVPIISFRTTQVPILRALSEAAVLEAFYKEIQPYFSASDNSNLTSVLEIRNAFAGVLKTITVYHWRESSISLTDRLGAQGLFGENQLIALEMELRGMTIAEGDVTVLCIRLASELLLGQFNRLLLPRSKALIIAIGQRMAYEAAVDARVDPVLVSLYQASAVIQDLSWHVESGKVSRKDAMAAEDLALTAAFVKLDEFLEQADCAPYVHAPISSQTSWDQYVANLPLRGRHQEMYTTMKRAKL